MEVYACDDDYGLFGVADLFPSWKIIPHKYGPQTYKDIFLLAKRLTSQT
jgi:hypothetical protein